MFMLTPPATYYLLAGKPEVARRYFVEEFMRAGDPFCGMHAALISDQLKDPKLRDQRLAEIAARHGGWTRISPTRPHNEIVALAAMFVADLGKKTNGDLDFKAIDNLLEKSTEMERINCRYFVGQYLRLRGKPELAIEPWLQCMPLLPMRAINRTLAANALLDAGVTPDVYEQAIKDRTAKPTAAIHPSK